MKWRCQTLAKSSAGQLANSKPDQNPLKPVKTCRNLSTQPIMKNKNTFLSNLTKFCSVFGGFFIWNYFPARSKPKVVIRFFCEFCGLSLCSSFSQSTIVVQARRRSVDTTISSRSFQSRSAEIEKKACAHSQELS